MPNGNCGIYSIIEGPLNATVDVTMDIHELRKLVYDYVNEHRDQLHTNLSYLRNTRSPMTKIKEKHDEMIKQQVMRRIWAKGVDFTKRAKRR